MRRRLAAVGSWLSLAAAVFVLGAVVLLQPAESTPIGLQRRETTTTATAGSPAGAEAESDDCRQRYLLPVIVGVVALLALLFILYYCGRQRINASLFEQTLRAERFAQVARQEAEIKASFLANMSHEIRTPLHAILSMGRLLMESRQMDSNADPQDLEDLAQIIRSSETLEALVNDVLFISKMQTSSFSLINKTFDVCEMLEDVTQLLALRWEGKKVECIVNLDLPEFNYMVTADPLRLRQVLTNLSTNAMKFTDEGHVALYASLVELHEDDDYASPPGQRVPHLLFRVQDTGAGMNAATMYNLFQRFFQGSNTIVQAVGGAGLGLAIAAELVSIMGGTIGVFSEGEGKGSEFWFTLPVTYQNPAEAQNKVNDGSVYDGTELKQHVARVAYERSLDFIQRPKEMPLPAELAVVCEKDFTTDMVLVVVPNEGLRLSLERMLQRWNLRFASGPTYEAATAMLISDPTVRTSRSGEQPRANIVIVDIEWQQLSTEVIQQPNTRFIFLCSDSRRRHLLRDVAQHWYSQCENYTLLNKPVKRQFLWKALCSQGHIEEAPTAAAIERIQAEFSFRRGDRPLRKHPLRGGNSDSPGPGALAGRRVGEALGEGADSRGGSQHSAKSRRASDRIPGSPRSERLVFNFNNAAGYRSTSLHSGNGLPTVVGASATLSGVVTPPLVVVASTPGASSTGTAGGGAAAGAPASAFAVSTPAKALPAGNGPTNSMPSAAAGSSTEPSTFAARTAMPPVTSYPLSGPAAVLSAAAGGTVTGLGFTAPHVSVTTALPEGRRSRVGSSGAMAALAEDEPAPRILLAEDNSINVRIAVRFLQWGGYDCTVATDGQQAIELWKSKGPFDLILMDCQMPIYDGFEVTRRIRAIEHQTIQGGREVPIVAMTAFSMPEDQERCLEQGMNDYISKPFSRETLLDMVSKWLHAAAAVTPSSSQHESGQPSPSVRHTEETRFPALDGLTEVEAPGAEATISALAVTPGSEPLSSAKTVGTDTTHGASTNITHLTASESTKRSVLPSSATVQSSVVARGSPRQVRSQPPAAVLPLVPEGRTQASPPESVLSSPSVFSPALAAQIPTPQIVLSSVPTSPTTQASAAQASDNLAKHIPEGKSPAAASRSPQPASSDTQPGDTAETEARVALPAPPKNSALSIFGGAPALSPGESVVPLPPAGINVADLLGQVLKTKPPTLPSSPDPPVVLRTHASKVSAIDRDLRRRSDPAGTSGGRSSISNTGNSQPAASTKLPPVTVNLTSLFSGLPPAPSYSTALASSSRRNSLQLDSPESGEDTGKIMSAPASARGSAGQVEGSGPASASRLSRQVDFSFSSAALANVQQPSVVGHDGSVQRETQRAPAMDAQQRQISQEEVEKDAEEALDGTERYV